MDVPLIVTVECRAFAYLTPTRDRISLIRTGRRATILVPQRLPSAVDGSVIPKLKGKRENSLHVTLPRRKACLRIASVKF
jgi:hypothetical protein